MQKWLLVLILFFAVSVQAQTDRHTIKAIASGGEVIILDDGTAWNVSNSSDFFTTKYWSKDADVLVINDEKIINAETNETVDVKPVREGDSYGQGSTGTGAQNNNALINATQHEFDLGAQEGAQAVEAEKQRQFQVEEAEKQRQFEERMAREHEEAETERLKLSLGRNSESTSTSKPQNTTTAHVSESRPVIQNRLLDLSESIAEDSLYLISMGHYVPADNPVGDRLNKNRSIRDSLILYLRKPIVSEPFVRSPNTLRKDSVNGK